MRYIAQLSLAVVAGFGVAILAPGQVQKEYIRLGGKVVAIETTNVATPAITLSLNDQSVVRPDGAVREITVAVSGGTWTIAAPADAAVLRVKSSLPCTPQPSGNALSALSANQTVCLWILPTTVARQVDVTATATNGQPAKVTLDQAAILPTPLNIGSTAGSADVALTGNSMPLQYAVQAESTGTWLSAVRITTGFRYTVTAQPANSPARTDSITIKSADGSPQPNVVLATYSVTQAASAAGGGGGLSACVTVSAARTSFNGSRNSENLAIKPLPSAAGATWSATSDQSWLGFLGTGMPQPTITGTGEINAPFALKVNGGGARTAKITVTCSGFAATTVTISQTPVSVISIAGPLSVASQQSAGYDLMIDGQTADDSVAGQITFTATGGSWCLSNCGIPGRAILNSAPGSGTTTLSASFGGLNASINIQHPTNILPEPGNVSISLASNAMPIVAINHGVPGVLKFEASPKQSTQLDWIEARIGTASITNPIPGECRVRLFPPGPGNLGGRGFLQLALDSGEFSDAIQPPQELGPGGGFLSNSYCRINLVKSTLTQALVAGFGGLVASVEVEFLTGFPVGEKGIDVSAKAGALTGGAGKWPLTINGAAPTVTQNPADAVTITHGTPVTFDVTADSVPEMWMLDLVVGSPSSGCSIRYQRPRPGNPDPGGYWLFDDQGGLVSVTPAGTSNSRCRVKTGSTIVSTAARVRITPEIEFFGPGISSGALTGGHAYTVTARNVSGGVTQKIQSLTFGGNQPPILVTQGLSRSGLSNPVSITFSDPNGAANIAEAGVLISQGINLGDCFVHWSRTNGFRLMNAASSGWITNTAVGNGNCAATGLTTSSSVNNLTINGTITLASTATVKTIYGWVIDQEMMDTSAWSAFSVAGTWTPGGTGNSQTVPFVVTSQLSDTTTANSTATFKIRVKSNGGFAGQVRFSGATASNGGIQCPAIAPVQLTANNTVETALVCTVAANTPGNEVWDAAEDSFNAPAYTISGLKACNESASANQFCANQPTFLQQVPNLVVYVRQYAKPALVSVTPAGTTVPIGQETPFTVVADLAAASAWGGVEIRLQEEGAQPATKIANSCSIRIYSTGGLQLRNDTGTPGPNMSLGTGTSQSNTLCSVRPAGGRLDPINSTTRRMTAIVPVTFLANGLGKVYRVWVTGLHESFRPGGWKEYGTIALGSSSSTGTAFPLSGVMSTGVSLDAAMKDQIWKMRVPLSNSDVQPFLVAEAPTNILWQLWQPNSAVSKWIGPVALPVTAAATASPGGDYSYTVKFVVPSGFSSGEILGAWAVDNRLTIKLNGVTSVADAPQDGQGFGVLTPFAVTEGFREGENTLEFLVKNQPFANGDGGATGLRVEITKAAIRFSDGYSLQRSPAGATTVSSGTGGSVRYTVQVNGATPTPLTLTTHTPIAGVEVTYAPSSTLSAGQFTQATLTVPASLAAGNYQVVLKADDSHVIDLPFTVIAGSPGFSLSTTAATATAGGAPVTSTVTVNPVNNFNSPVTLSQGSGWPAGVTATFGTNPTTTTSVATITVSSAVAPNTYNLAVNGVGNSVNATTTIPLTVSSGTATFAVTALKAYETVQAGTSEIGTFTARVAALNGTSGTVALTLGNPAGLNCTLSQSSVTLTANGSANVTVSCPAPTTAPGVVGLQDGSTYAPYTITLSAPGLQPVNFTLTARPWAYLAPATVTAPTAPLVADTAALFTMSSIWDAPGGVVENSRTDVLFQDPSIGPGVMTGACMVSLNFGSSVTVFESTDPNILWMGGGTRTNGRCTVDSTPATHALTNNPSSQTNTWTNLAIKFHSIWNNKTLRIYTRSHKWVNNEGPRWSGWKDVGSVVIGNGGVVSTYTLTADPTTRSVSPGGNGDYPIALTSGNGFTGPVALTITSALPTGVTANWIASPNVSASTSTTLRLTTSATTPTGTHTVTVQSDAQHVVTLSLVVGGSPVLNVKAVKAYDTVQAGTGLNATFTALVQGKNGFAGVVSLDPPSVAPAGVNCTVAPTSVTLAANGASTVTVSCLAPASAPGVATVQGEVTYTPYVITLTGRSGTLVSQTGSMTMTVRPWAYLAPASVSPEATTATAEVAAQFTMSSLWDAPGGVVENSRTDVLFQDPSIGPGVTTGACMVSLNFGGSVTLFESTDGSILWMGGGTRTNGRCTVDSAPATHALTNNASTQSNTWTNLAIKFHSVWNNKTLRVYTRSYKWVNNEGSRWSGWKDVGSVVIGNGGVGQ